MCASWWGVALSFKGYHWCYNSFLVIATLIQLHLKTWITQFQIFFDPVLFTAMHSQFTPLLYSDFDSDDCISALVVNPGQLQIQKWLLLVRPFNDKSIKSVPMQSDIDIQANWALRWPGCGEHQMPQSPLSHCYLQISNVTPWHSCKKCFFLQEPVFRWNFPNIEEEFS